MIGNGYKQHLVWHYWGLTNIASAFVFIVFQFGLEVINLSYKQNISKIAIIGIRL